MRKGYILTRKETAEIFWLLSQARIKFTGKNKTSAEKYYEKFEEALDLKVYPELKNEKENEK